MLQLKTPTKTVQRRQCTSDPDHGRRALRQRLLENVDLKPLEKYTRKTQVQVASDPVHEPVPEIDPDNIHQNLVVSKKTLHGIIRIEVLWRILKNRIENNLKYRQQTSGE